MSQKNIIVAIVLSVSFLLLWSLLVMPHFTPPPAPPAPMENAAVSPASSGTSFMASGTTAVAGSLHDTPLQDDQDSLVLSPPGAAVKSWVLKSKGHDVDLVNDPNADLLPLTSFPKVAFKILTHDRQAVMEGILQPGLRVMKILTLTPVGHLHDLTYRFQNSTGQPITLKNWEWNLGPGLGTTESERKDNGGLTRAITLGPIKLHVVKEGDHADFGRWAGVDNRYFLTALIPTSDAARPQLYVTGSKEQTILHIVETTLVPAHGQTILDYQLYVGPKGYTQLEAYGKNLEESVDFGFFSPLGKVILKALYWLKGLTGNYGWSIILLTVCLQIMLLPLTIKSFKAALAMKKLQPKIAALQAQYKGDPKRLQVEMMNLYKTSGSNPFGGCLPMLLQLPIFWALFTTLRNAYELRNAPFIFWIHDLSVADPYRVLPIIMGVGMFFQQRMSGAVTDPTQRQMMRIMPIMFTFMFMNFPAGMVLYWLTNSIMTMIFQYSYQRYTQSGQGTFNRPQVIS